MRVGLWETDRLAAVLASVLFCILCIQVVLGYSLETWNLSEWLINYAGGFVRRGLPGEIIFQLSRATGTSPYSWAVGTSLAALVVTLGAVVVRSRGRLHRYILYSPVLFGGAILGDYWFRKDLIGVLSILVCLQLLFGMGIARRGMRIALANLVCILMMLSHEAFGFYALPILVFANAAERRWSTRVSGSFRALISSMLEFSGAVVAFVIVIAFKGSEAAALEVHRSWSGLYFPFDAWTPYPDAPKAAIDGIGWTTRAGVDYGLAVWTKFSWGIYAPLAWMITWYLSAGFLVGSIRSTTQPDTIPPSGSRDLLARERERFARVLLLQFLAVLPLFILGCDYGRWIFFWGLGAIVIYLYTPGEVLDVLPGADFLRRFTGGVERVFKPHPALLLLFAVPPVNWTVERYIRTTLPGALFEVLDRLVLTMSLG